MLNQEARLHPQLFLTNFSQSKNLRQSLSTRKRQTQHNVYQKQKVSSMKDEYTPFDLYAAKNKDLIQAGPSLKKLDQVKKQYDLQQLIKREQEKERLKEMLLQKKKQKKDANNVSEEENKETKQLMNYLSEDYYKKLVDGESRKHMNDEPLSYTETYLLNLKKKMQQISKSQNSENSPKHQNTDKSQIKMKPITMQKVEEGGTQRSNQSSPKEKRKSQEQRKDQIELGQQRYAIRSRFSSHHQNNNEQFYSTLTCFNTTRETFNSKIMMDTLRDKKLNLQMLQEQSKRTTTTAHKTRKVQLQQFNKVINQLNQQLMESRTYKHPIMDFKSKSHTNLVLDTAKMQQIQRNKQRNKSQFENRNEDNGKKLNEYQMKEQEIDKLVDTIMKQVTMKLNIQ